MSQPLRIGAVNYLNTKPLVYGLEEQVRKALVKTPYDGGDLSFAVPSRLADDLAAGRLDVALIPSIEYLQHPGYTMVSDACIACRGPVLSVKLFSRVPIEQVRTLALDEGSRTSVALVRILLAERYGLRPRLVPLPIGAMLGDVPADATLLIGDRAIQSPPGKFADVWDLGDVWTRWSGLPFVFAMWVARAGVATAEIASALSQARDLGVANLATIADREAAPLGLTRPQCLSYLRDNLHFHLGERERAGLQWFFEHAARMKLVPAAATHTIDTEHARGRSTARQTVG